MWIGDHWKNLHEDIVALLDCKKHKHSFLFSLNSENWMEILDVDYNIIDSVRRKVLAPFLFMDPYTKPVFSIWGKNCGLLPKEGIPVIADGNVDREVRKNIYFVDGIAYNTAVILTCIVHFVGKCDHVDNVLHNLQRKCHELSDCFNLEDTVKCLKNDEIFKIVRKHVPDSQFSNKMVTAVCATAFVTFNDVYGTSDVEEQPDDLSNKEKNMKDMGNSEYKEGDYVQAIASYTKIIKTRHYNHIIYNNRALAFLKLNKWAEAEVDGHRTVVLNAAWCKGYCSFVQALEVQDQVHHAHLVGDYGTRRCDSVCPHFDTLNDTMMRLLKICSKCSASVTGSRKQFKTNNSSKNNAQKGGSVPANGFLNDIPDLVSDSESDVEASKVIPEQPSTKSTIKSSFPSLESLHTMLAKEWKQGSEAIASTQYHVSLKHFQNSRTLISSLKQQNYELEPFQIVLLKYAISVAHLQLGALEDLKKSISLLKEIVNTHTDVRLPCAYYMWGLALYKMNKFEEALVPLTNGISVVEKGILFPSYEWPGTEVIIEETQSANLTKLLQDLVEKCRYPPTPEAVCRFDSCSFTKNIFYSDPDFKGFFRVSCSENCHLEYHPHCWKLLKEQFNKKEKDFLGQTCLTPDCQSSISEIEIVDKDGLSKKFEGESNTTKQKEKQRKTKLEKKLEQKAKKKQKRREEKNVKIVENEDEEENEDESTKNSPAVDFNAELIRVEEKVEFSDNHEILPADPEKENFSPNHAQAKLYEDNAEPLYVLRKGNNDMISQTSEPKHSRPKKKIKHRNVMSADEFCGDHLSESQYYNEYLSRVSNLKMTKAFAENGIESWASFCESSQEMIPDLDRDKPFFIPEDLRNNPEVLESILQACGRLDLSESDQRVRENIYSFMEDYLEEQGPTAKDSLALQHEVQTFPTEAQELISRSNGLVNFLLESFRFAEVKDCICVMKDMGKAYCMSNQGEKYSGAYSLDLVDDFGGMEMDDFPDDGAFRHVEQTTSEAEAVNSSVATDCSQTDNHFTDRFAPENDEDDDNESSSCALSSSIFRKLNNTIRTSSPASQFQLQVLIRSLNESQQNVLLVSSLNALIENNCTVEQLQTINKKVKSIELHFPVKIYHKNIQTDKVVISAKEVDTDVYVQLKNVQEENSCLQERIINAEDSLVRVQNQHSVKWKDYEKEIGELQERLRGELMMKTAYEVERETERRRAQQEAKQAKQEQQNVQNMLEKLMKQVDQLTAAGNKKAQELESACSSLAKEQFSASNLQETLKSTLESNAEITLRAKHAEREFLEMRESCGLLKFDEAIAKCTSVLSKLDEDRRRFGTPSVLDACLTQLSEDAKKYLKKLEAARQDFLKSCQEQKDKLENGEKPSLDSALPTLPEIPSSVEMLFTSKLTGSESMFPPSFMPPPPHAMFSQGMPRFPGHFNPPIMFRPNFPSVPQPPMFVDGLPMNKPPLRGPPGLDTPFPNEKKSNAMSLSSAFLLPNESKPKPTSETALLPTFTVRTNPEKKLERPPENPFVSKVKKSTSSEELGAVGPAAGGLKSYDNLTPIPLTSYDGLCDISMEEKRKGQVPSSPVKGAIAKVPTKSQVDKVPTISDQNAFSSAQAKVRQSSYGKLISKLQVKFPILSVEKLDEHIVLFRAKHNNKLTGLTIDQIVDGIASDIEFALQSNIRQKVKKKAIVCANGEAEEKKRFPLRIKFE